MSGDPIYNLVKASVIQQLEDIIEDKVGNDFIFLIQYHMLPSLIFEMKRNMKLELLKRLVK